MRVTITIDTDNDAFHGWAGPEGEVARILRKLADGIGRTADLAVGETHTLRDINGNAVGRMEVE